jgi:Uma2 family endonuclease
MTRPSPAGPPFTPEDLARARDGGASVELIDGVLVEKAAPSPEHGSAQLGLGDVLGPFRGRDGGGRGPGGWWLMTEVEVRYGADVYRHDAVGFRRELHPVRPSGLPASARPDWVCEILSRSTARYDMVQKLRTLHSAGVPFYWLLDPERATLTVLKHEPQSYATLLTAASGEVVHAEPFAAHPIAIALLLGDED